LTSCATTCATLPLRAKKYDEAGNLWQARVNLGWRFYFAIRDNTYLALDTIPHPK
jgi:hypothetical protein